jgi:hypothetical protein
VGWESVAQRPGGNRGVEACPSCHGRTGATAGARVAPRPDFLPPTANVVAAPSLQMRAVVAASVKWFAPLPGRRAR